MKEEKRKEHINKESRWKQSKKNRNLKKIKLKNKKQKIKSLKNMIQCRTSLGKMQKIFLLHFQGSFLKNKYI